MTERIEVLVVEPGRDPVHQSIRNELEAFQQIVGGHIEIMPVGEFVLIFNEEGKLLNFQPSGVYLENDPLVGPVIFAKSAGEEFASLTKDNLDFLRRTIVPPVQIKF